MVENLKKVAIVIPVYNRRDTTLQGLRSLSRINTEGLDVKVYVVDDASPDGTADAIKENYPEVELLHGDGFLHYAGGTSLGMEAALSWDPDFIATMNDDSIFHELFLQRLIKTAEENPNSIVGALLLLWDEPHKVFQVGQSWQTLYGGWRIPNDLTAFTVPNKPFEVECIVGNCVLFPVKAVKENGLMDGEKFKHGWGDAPYLMRMRKAGWKLLIQPKSYVWCEPNTYPPPLHTLPIKEVLYNLFVNKGNPLNFRTQFEALWESSPSKVRAVVAFSVYCLKLGIKSLRLSDPFEKIKEPERNWKTVG